MIKLFNEEPSLSIEDYDIAIEAIHTNDAVIANMLDSNERLFGVITALESAEVAIKSNKGLSLESIELIGNLTTSGTNLPSDYFFSSIMSLEEIAHKKRNAFQQFFQNMAVYFSKIFDNLHYYETAFNLQRSRLNTCKRRLSNVSDTVIPSVSVNITKYIQTGSNEYTVRDIKEYRNAFVEMADVMSSMNEGLADLAEDDLFTTLKMIGSFFKGDSDKYFKDRFQSLQSTFDKVKRSTHLKVENKRPASTEYASNILLGLSQVVLSEPNKSTYDFGDQRSLVDAHKHFYLYIERIHKVKLSNLVSGSTRLEVDKKSLEPVLKSAETLLDSANRLNSYGAKLSSYYAGMQNGSLYITALRDDDSDQVIMAMTRAGRILNRISAILYDSVASSYNFSLGNVKKALTITEAFLDKVD